MSYVCLHGLLAADMLCCMRTTLNLDDRLMIEAKILAVRRRTTLTALIEQALRDAIVESPREWNGLPPPVNGGGLPLDVDLDRSWALIEKLEGLDARS